MKARLFTLTVMGAAALMLAGCSSYMKSSQTPDPDILAARSNYESEWDEAIDQHEVHKGMEIADVYFSWGRPVHRLRTGERERWIYLFDDVESQPTRVVWLFFEGGRLRKWTVDSGHMEFVNPSKIDLPAPQGLPPATETGK